MRVLVSTESRFDRTPDGACWNVGWASYAFWRRYLDVFDAVRILARVRDVPKPPADAVRATGPSVSIEPIPYYLGPWEYLRRQRSIRRAVDNALHANTDAVIVRAPGAVTGMVVPVLAADRRPFGIEVVGDPYDVFAPAGVRTVFRPLLRHVMSRQLQRQCDRACAVAYVTFESLQRRYPARAGTYVTRYSSIDLPDDAFVQQSRTVQADHQPKHTVFIGSLEQLYKAPDVLIDAVAAATNAGADIHVSMIGDGKHRADLERDVAARGLQNRVRFVGHLPPGDAIRRELDAADLFVLPSRTEGLPRAVIEAMARGLPCVGSNVGGIPELLAAEELVTPGDAGALATKLVEVLRDPARLARLSGENLLKAREYHVDVLRPRRRQLYQAVRDETLRWQDDSR